MEAAESSLKSEHSKRKLPPIDPNLKAPFDFSLTPSHAPSLLRSFLSFALDKQDRYVRGDKLGQGSYRLKDTETAAHSHFSEVYVATDSQREFGPIALKSVDMSDEYRFGWSLIVLPTHTMMDF